MATHSSILAWRITWIEEPGGLPSMGSQRVGHDRVTQHSTAASRRTGQADQSGECQDSPTKKL